MADDDVETMSLKALKELIASAGLSLDGCIEKPDIRQRAREAQAALATKAEAPPPARGGSTKQTLGGYSCIVKAPEDVLSGAIAADLAVIVLHGYGASSSDFADVPSLIDPHLAGKRVLYVFPQAPSTAIGTAWWQIDLMGFLTLATSGEAAIAKMIREEPKGLREARASLAKLLEQVCAMAGAGTPLPTSRVVLGGFSQGAMTALDAALQQGPGQGVAGVLCLSGAPIVVEQWTARLQEHKGLRVLLTHGMQDSTLPFACSGWTHELLKANGADVTYVPFQGGHELGGHQVIEALVAFVRASLP
mmetsp:Transcript_11154/g.22604  ORF Transcript_11154/g.22604 Transcript_11154/m.22604 type:complete len:305 (-) Transcript_11154:180-1094(-)